MPLKTLLFGTATTDSPAVGAREKGVLFGAIAILYLLAGAGRYSLDAVIGGRGRGRLR